MSRPESAGNDSLGGLLATGMSKEDTCAPGSAYLTAGDVLTLFDWKRKISALYAEVQGFAKSEAAWLIGGQPRVRLQFRLQPVLCVRPTLGLPAGADGKLAPCPFGGRAADASKSTRRSPQALMPERSGVQSSRAQVRQLRTC